MRTRIKICGIRQPKDAGYAADLGVDALGLVFYSGSSRCVSIDEAVAIADRVPPFVTLVGLFVNASDDQVAEVLRRVPLTLLQFHGDEDNRVCARFGIPFIKALRVKSGVDVRQSMALFPAAQGLLLDAWHPDRFGGTGQVFDWQQVPLLREKPLILAGGLNPENVAEAIRYVQPWAVDVSGGVERIPGIKDSELMRAFVEGVNCA